MGKEKIATYFNNIQEKEHNLFVPYIVAGDGENGVDNLAERIQFLENAGAAAIELGIPFSDPVADGPTIQEGSIRALDNGTTLQKVLDVVATEKENREVPIILMTYINPIFAFGVDAFAETCERSGVDGVIIPDVPLEEEALLTKSLTKHSIAFIRLAALTSPPERLKKIAERSEGFLYAVAVKGTTGVRDSHEEDLGAYLSMLKKYSQVPVLAGFGVSNAEQAHAMSNHCDGVIVGSKIVDLLHQGKTTEVHDLIQASITKNPSYS